MADLKLGLAQNGKPFGIPRDAVIETFAVMGVRGAGKTTAAAVLAEEMCKAGLPWICLDPVGVWWGMRANAAGKPGARRMLELLIEHGELTKGQLSTLSGVASSTFRGGMAWLKRNGLVTVEGDTVRLNQV